MTKYIFRENKEKSAEHLKNKFNYLMKVLPFINPEQYIFTAYHNKNIKNEELKEKGIVRVNSWRK